VQRGAGVGCGPQVDCCRFALSVWIRKLDVSVNFESRVPASSADGAMFDWLVESVRCGWTPMEVVVWVFQVLGIYCSRLSLIASRRRGLADNCESVFQFWGCFGQPHVSVVHEHLGDGIGSLFQLASLFM
jgi:hypothetical protein